MNDPARFPGASAHDPAQPLHMDMATYMMAAAHDMKNSVCVMTAFLEKALDEIPADGASRTMTHQALYEAQRVNSHLMQILALYKIDEGLYPFDPVEVDLAAFAHEVLGGARGLAESKGVALDVQPCGQERFWYFDRDLVLSIVAQSLHNAIKYTRDRVRLGLRVTDGQLEIRVEDNGRGFPEFMLERGFPAQQGIDARTGSTGLGLYFASRVARMHRNRGLAGQTRLENRGDLGGGRFVLSLP